MSEEAYERIVQFARLPELKARLVDRKDRSLYYRAHKDWYWHDAEEGGERERGLYRRPKKSGERWKRYLTPVQCFWTVVHIHAANQHFRRDIIDQRLRRQYCGYTREELG